MNVRVTFCYPINQLQGRAELENFFFSEFKARPDLMVWSPGYTSIQLKEIAAPVTTTEVTYPIRSFTFTRGKPHR